MHIRDIIEEYLGNDAEKFAEWAVGKDFMIIHLTEWPTHWNERHGKDYLIHENSIISIDMKYMIELWKKEIDTKMIQE